MTKKEYISHKIRILEHENKGRSHSENIAIAISMANKKYGMQQGGEYQMGGTYNPFSQAPQNPYGFPYGMGTPTTGSDYMPQIGLLNTPGGVKGTGISIGFSQPIAPQTTGVNTQGSIGNRPQQIIPTQTRLQAQPLNQVSPQGNQPITSANSQVETVNQLTPQGIQSSTTPDLSGVQKSYQYNQPKKDLEWKSTEKSDQQKNADWQRYHLANIYGSGLGTSEAFALTGKYAGEGNTGMAVGAGALSAIKGAKDFLTGYSAGKTNKRTYEDYLKKLETDQPYSYLSETPLQATAQQGGYIPQQSMSYQTSMQPVYQKAGEQGLNQLDYYKMLMQSAQTPFVNPPQDVDLSQQVYQESYIPNKDLTANDYLNNQGMQQGGYTENATTQPQQGEKSSADVTNAQMMTGAFVTDQENPTVNVEKDEQIKNSQTQEIQKAVGNEHKDGGIDVNLPQGSQVLSNYTKIKSDEAKKFAKDYGINVTTKNTYAEVLDKVNNKIGWTKTIKEEEDLIKKIEDVRSSSKDENTLNINMKFLQNKYKELNSKKALLQQEQKAAFDNLFQTQEGHEKKGNGELLNEDGTPMHKYGGEVYELANKYNVHPDKVYEFMQQGGAVQEQPQGQPQDMQSQVIQMLNNGANPEQVVQILVENNVPQEDAIRLVQAITSGEQQQQQAPPLQTAQQGGWLKQYAGGGTTDGNPPLINSTLLTTFTNEPAGLTNLPYTPTGQAPNPIWAGNREAGSYKDVWMPLVNQTMSNTETAKKVDKWLTENKDTYSPNIQKQLEGLTGQKRYDRIEYLATDAKPGPFHNAVLQAMKTTASTPTAAAATSATTAPEKKVVEGQNKPIEKTAVPVLPNPYILPPTSLQPVGKWDVSLGRVEPAKQTTEPYLATLAQQQLSGQRSNLQNLTPEAAAAANAMLQATTGAQANQAVAQTEEANRQAIYASELQNLQQADKEKITQAGINEAYQTKMYNAMNNTEKDWRNYFNQKSGQDIQNYKDVQGMQLLNAMSPDYQYTGNDVVFSNRPYETPQQKSDREYQAEMLKYYTKLTPAQRAELEKKATS